MAAVWSLGRTKYHKIGHRGQNNDKCQYDSPICLNETESLPFVIKITKSVTHRSTPLFQKIWCPIISQSGSRLFVGLNIRNSDSQSEACLFVRIALSRDLNLTFHHLAVLELSDEKNRTSK